MKVVIGWNLRFSGYSILIVDTYKRSIWCSCSEKLTQFYVNFSRQEHQIDVLYVSFNSQDSQVSVYTPSQSLYSPFKSDWFYLWFLYTSDMRISCFRDNGEISEWNTFQDRKIIFFFYIVDYMTVKRVPLWIEHLKFGSQPL